MIPRAGFARCDRRRDWRNRELRRRLGRQDKDGELGRMRVGPFVLALLVVAGCGGAVGGAPTLSVAPSIPGVAASSQVAVASSPTTVAPSPTASGATINDR